MLSWLTGDDPGRLRNQALALAGLMQAVRAVREVAREGRLDTDAFNTAVGSVLRIDAASAAEVFGGETCVRGGLAALEAQFAPHRREAENEEARYAAAALLLGRALMRKTDAATRLRGELERIERLHATSGPAPARLEAADDDAPLPSDAVVEALADAYKENVSAIGPRIMVYGDPAILNQPHHAARVRVLLLGAVRAAVLWVQSGGSRFKLIAGRRALLETVESLKRGAA